MSAIDAFTLVDYVFHHPSGGVEELIRLSGDQETDWLEFKAALYPLESEVKARPEAFAWNATKALIAMANTCGGAVLLGIDDKRSPVSLENERNQGFLEREGADAFIRMFIEPKLFPANRHFRVTDEKKISVNTTRLRELVNPKVAQYRGQSVLSLLVKPVPSGESLLRVVESSPEREYIPVRATGVGRVRPIVLHEEQEAYARSRSLQREEFAAMLDGFCRSKGIDKIAVPIFQNTSTTEIDSALSDKIVSALSCEPLGLSIYDLEDAIEGDYGIDVIQDHLSALHQEGMLYLVKGHLWRLAGMFPAHQAADVIATDQHDVSRWSEFRRICYYYVDCNLASGSKGIALWPNQENKEYLQLAARLEWDTLFQGEPIYLSDWVIPGAFDKKLFVEECGVLLCGPVYCSKPGRPLMPAFLCPGLVQWIKDKDIIRIVLTGPPEINDEWLNNISEGPEDRKKYLQLFNSESSGRPVRAGWNPPRTLQDWYRDLNKVLKKDEVAEYPCLSSLDTATPFTEIKRNGYYNRILIIPQKAQVYTSRLQRELRKIASASDEDLDKTALVHLFPRGDGADTRRTDTKVIGVVPQLQVLSPDQRHACALAAKHPVVVVTGPPGTGKSRVVANTMAQFFVEQRSVLFASRNHEALNAVVPYLNEFGDQVPVCGRLSQPYQDNAPDPLKEVLGRLFNNTVAITNATQEEIEDVIAEVAGIKTQLAVNYRILEERAGLYNEADRLSSEAENSLGTVGVLADLVRKHARILQDDQWAQRYLARLARTRPEKGFVVVRVFNQLFNSLNLRATIKEATIATSKLEEVVAGSPIDQDLALLAGKEPVDLEKRQTALDLFVKLAAIAKLHLEAQEKRAALDRVEPLDKIEGNIAVLQNSLCKATERLVKTTAKAAGYALDGKEREKIDGLHSALKAQASPTRLQALVRRNFPVLLKYLPLWAVSNLSAGKHLPLEPGLFDLLIIDEASQCDIASVVPLLYRAKRVMVVGDRQQLRFVSGLSLPLNQKLRARYRLTETDHADRYDYCVNSFFDLANGSAIADLTSRVLLKDHYRCHRHIADYFNRTFYGGALYINTDENKLKGQPGKANGMCWTQVPADAQASDVGGGAISTGQVEAICAELRRLADAQYPGTVGVVTPFRRQADRIRDAVNSAFASNPPAHWKFQCDTADGFQGGERDLILFSLVGGPKMPPSCSWFYEQDPNRFNVAVSRAKAVLRVFGDREWVLEWAKQNDRRKHLEILAMVSPSGEAPPIDEQPRGEKPPIIGDPDRIGPVWEPKLASALWQLGLPVQQQYPACGRYLDIALIKQGKKLAIEVDGEAYHRGRDGNRKKEDIMRDIVLIANGWQVKRFWVYQLRENWNACLEEIKQLWNEES